MATEPTPRAVKACKWVLREAPLGSKWVWRATTKTSTVFFSIKDYSVLADPERGCVFELCDFLITSPDGSGWPRRTMPEGLPDWYKVANPGVTVISAIDLKQLVEEGAIQKQSGKKGSW